MIEKSETRQNASLAGDHAPGRDMSRAGACERVAASAKRREGELFAERDIQKPRTYQISPE